MAYSKPEHYFCDIVDICLTIVNIFQNIDEIFAHKTLSSLCYDSIRFYISKQNFCYISNWQIIDF